jgi:hypothetical protein
MPAEPMAWMLEIEMLKDSGHRPKPAVQAENLHTTLRGRGVDDHRAEQSVDAAIRDRGPMAWPLLSGFSPSAPL